MAEGETTIGHVEFQRYLQVGDTHGLTGIRTRTFRYNYEGEVEQFMQVPVAFPWSRPQQKTQCLGLQTSVLLRCFKFCSFQRTINQFLDFQKSSLPVNLREEWWNVSKERDSLMHFAMEITAIAAWGQGLPGKRTGAH